MDLSEERDEGERGVFSGAARAGVWESYLRNFVDLQRAAPMLMTEDHLTYSVAVICGEREE